MITYYTIKEEYIKTTKCIISFDGNGTREATCGIIDKDGNYIEKKILFKDDEDILPYLITRFMAKNIFLEDGSTLFESWEQVRRENLLSKLGI